MNTPDIWCVAGLPGSGKTTISKALAESLNYEHIERDFELEALNAQYYPPQLLDFADVLYNAAEKMDSPDETVKVTASATVQQLIPLADAFTEHLRPLFDRAMSIIENTDYISGRHDFYAIVQRLREIDQMEGVDFFFEVVEPSMRNLLVLALGHTLFIEKGLQSKKGAIIDSHDLNYRKNRRFTLNKFLNKGVSPGLIIITTTREQVFAVAKEREAQEGQERGVKTLKAILEKAEPYNPQERWPRVVTIDRTIPTTTDQIRIDIDKAGPFTEHRLIHLLK
ncbi:AAA family ATPase [Candidatus Peregrinibacteria bacterium]|jgi:tRNA uridine 5-carbamoylmethylation protein Kti12|nr:AAA family ATPase [Candidatus Peregrinibacteria bacterium]MBT7736935.1 AAA family ATPase [Candidatus Peregrinibacteria bacterium]